MSQVWKRENCPMKSQRKTVEKIYPITKVFNPLLLEEKKNESSSRANFATILVRNFSQTKLECHQTPLT